jgi:UPF0176 protein
MSYHVAAFYRFVQILDPAALQTQLRAALAPWPSLCGSLLIAPEGINGTLAGQDDAIDRLLDILAESTGLSRADVKFSTAPSKPFSKLKLRLKREIITFKQPQADPTRLAGTYVTPQDWNALLADPDVTVLDTRNLYETAIGSFKGAQNPNIECFTEFADYVRTQLDPAREKKIAMFCTGGIRCEKASAFMRAEGFADVYHLQGGILKYLEEVPPAESQWQGACYVFDKRVAVGHGLSTGDYHMCFCCGYPLTATDTTHAHYEAGVSCAWCYAQSSAADKARFRTRQHQMTAADSEADSEADARAPEPQQAAAVAPAT